MTSDWCARTLSGSTDRTSDHYESYTVCAVPDAAAKTELGREHRPGSFACLCMRDNTDPAWRQAPRACTFGPNAVVWGKDCPGRVCRRGTEGPAGFAKDGVCTYIGGEKYNVELGGFEVATTRDFNTLCGS